MRASKRTFTDPKESWALRVEFHSKLRPHYYPERSHGHSVLEYLNTCASLQYNKRKGISDLLGCTKFNLPWIGKLAAGTPLANGRRQALSLFQQTMLCKRTPSCSGCGFIYCFNESLLCNHNTLMTCHTARKGSSRNPLPSLVFHVAGSQPWLLGAWASGVCWAFVLISDVLLSPIPPSPRFLLPPDCKASSIKPREPRGT